MSRRSSRVTGQPRLPRSAPPFPRAVSTFVGRRGELERVLELLDREVVFVVYGVGGVGKSEFVYKAIEQALELERWSGAIPLLLEAQPHFGIDHLVALLRARTGTALAPIEGRRSEAAGRRDDLAELAQGLDAVPYMVFIDDAHHLDSGDVAEVLAFVTRHVRASRLFVASRLEIPRAPGAPTTVVTRLGPLDPEATGEMLTMLSRRLGIDAPDAGEVFRRSKGSPFFIQRELADHGRTTDAAVDSLDHSLRELSPRARRLLLLATATQGRLAIADLGRPVGATEELDGLDELLGELGRRFLIDFDRDVVLVHDLVRESLLRQASEAEVQHANRAASELFVERFVSDPEHNHADLIEAIHRRLAAGDLDDVWALIERWYRSIAAVGLDHLLLRDLEALRSAAAEHRLAVELLTARILLRRSLIAEAHQIIRRLAGDDQARASFRYLSLAGEVAQRSGEIDRAARLFQGAHDAALESTDRFQADLQLALVASLRGDGGQARGVLDTAIAGFEWPSARHRGRWGWTAAASYALEERFEGAVVMARRAAVDLKGQGLDDLRVWLAMVETLALVECDEVAQARALVEASLARPAGTAGLREQVSSLYQGVVLFGEGDMRGASVALRGAHEYLSAHGDHVYACIAGYYLAGAHLALGDLERVAPIAERATEQARTAGLACFMARGMALHARLRFELGETRDAGERLAAAGRQPQVSVRARVAIHCQQARAHATAGDIDAAGAELRAARAVLTDEHVIAPRYWIDLEEADTALIGGDFARTIECAEQARAHYASCGRSHDEARACVALAAGCVARAGDADLVLADKHLARAGELAAAREYRPVAAQCAIIAGGLALRRGETGRAREIILQAYRTVGSAGTSLQDSALRVALHGKADATTPPGIVMRLGHLGLLGASRYQIADRHGRRAANRADVDREASRRELVVDVTRSVIRGHGGGSSVAGRPITCELLAVLVKAQGGIVTAEELYRAVWGAAEYHPLRHRNTLYVAINRLRKTLREIFPDREIVETAPKGWRIADDVDACSICEQVAGG